MRAGLHLPAVQVATVALLCTGTFGCMAWSGPTSCTVVQFVGAMGPPGGGRNAVTARYLRHFATISFAELADKSVQRIFTTILGAHAVKACTEAVQVCFWIRGWESKLLNQLQFMTFGVQNGGWLTLQLPKATRS